MTTREISLLKASFQKIGPIAEQAATLFYTRLFELDPSLREFFQENIAERSRKLWSMLSLAVNGIEHIETLAPMVRQLGLHQAGYFVKERHYDTVGDALLWTLAKGLGADFTQETRTAWGKTYWMLAETMRAGARDGTAKLNRAAA